MFTPLFLQTLICVKQNSTHKKFFKNQKKLKVKNLEEGLQQGFSLLKRGLYPIFVSIFCCYLINYKVTSTFTNF